MSDTSRPDGARVPADRYEKNVVWAEAEDRPGDPACWLCRVCPACGNVAPEDPPTTCPACEAVIPRV
jgi:rubrerythrin